MHACMYACMYVCRYELNSTLKDMVSVGSCFGGGLEMNEPTRRL